MYPDFIAITSATSDGLCIVWQLNENWKYHKPRIASYWLVKLDSIKRRKVSSNSQTGTPTFRCGIRMNNVFSSAMIEMLDLGFTLQTKYPDYTSSLMKSVREVQRRTT